MCGQEVLKISRILRVIYFGTNKETLTAFRGLKKTLVFFKPLVFQASHLMSETENLAGFWLQLLFKDEQEVSEIYL